MEKVDTLYHINMTDDEKDVVTSIINVFGTGQHPYASIENVHGFARTYLIDILSTEDFKTKLAGQTEKVKKIVEDLRAKL